MVENTAKDLASSATIFHPAGMVSLPCRVLSAAVVPLRWRDAGAHPKMGWRYVSNSPQVSVFKFHLSFTTPFLQYSTTPSPIRPLAPVFRPTPRANLCNTFGRGPLWCLKSETPAARFFGKADNQQARSLVGLDERKACNTSGTDRMDEAGVVPL